MNEPEKNTTTTINNQIEELLSLVDETGDRDTLTSTLYEFQQLLEDLLSEGAWLSEMPTDVRITTTLEEGVDAINDKLNSILQ
jgi:hypothetical protein